MAADAASRKVVRNAVVALFQAALTGIGKPVHTVENGPVEYDVKKRTPYLTVASGGSGRKHSGISDTKYHNVFRFEVTTFVRSADIAKSWTEVLIEDTLDEVDVAIANVIADNRVNANWSFIGFARDPAGDPEMSEIVTDTARKCVMEMRAVYVHYIEA